MSLAQDIAAYALGLRLDDVPHAAREAACRHMLDGVGTAVAAIRTSAGLPAMAVTQANGDGSSIRLLGSDSEPSHTAAFGMAAAVHALDFDDTHAGALIHPTTVVLPVALAVGREIGSSGSEVLEAALVGYEIGCRLGAATPFGFHAAGIHATSAVGVIAAAAVSARLLALEVTEYANALCIAASVAGGLLESLGTGTKQLHPAFAASNGIVATRLAAAGADGATTALEGKQGLFATLSQREARPETVTEGLGTRWEVTQISIKPYPCCQLMHSSLDASSLAMLEYSGQISDITRVEVHAHPDSLGIVGKTGTPRDSNEAKFSLAWTLAALLVDGAVTVDTFTPRMLVRDEVAALAGKVKTSDLASAEVAANGAARVILHTVAGAVAQGAVPCSKGTPARPLSVTELLAKFYANCGGSTESAVAAANWILALAEQDKVDGLLEFTDKLLAH